MILVYRTSIDSSESESTVESRVPVVLCSFVLDIWRSLRAKQKLYVGFF